MLVAHVSRTHTAVPIRGARELPVPMCSFQVPFSTLLKFIKLHILDVHMVCLFISRHFLLV